MRFRLLTSSTAAADEAKRAQTVLVSSPPARLYLGVADAAVGAVLADDGGFGLLELELSGHAVEKESLAPLYHTGHLIITNTQTH